MQDYNEIISDISTKINSLTKEAKHLMSEIERMSAILNLPVNFVEENISPLESRVSKLTQKHSAVQARFDAEYKPLYNKVIEIGLQLGYELPKIDNLTVAKLQTCLSDLKLERKKRSDKTRIYKERYNRIMQYLGVEIKSDVFDGFTKIDKNSMQKYDEELNKVYSLYNKRQNLINEIVEKLHWYCSIALCKLPEVVYESQLNGSDNMVKALKTELQAKVATVHWSFAKRIEDLNVGLGLHFEERELGDCLAEPSEDTIDILHQRLIVLEKMQNEPARRDILRALIKYDEILKKEETVDQLKSDTSPRSYISSHSLAYRLKEEVERQKRKTMKDIIETLSHSIPYYCNHGYVNLYDVLLNEKNNPRSWSEIMTCVLDGEPITTISKSISTSQNLNNKKIPINLPSKSEITNSLAKPIQCANLIINRDKTKASNAHRHSCGIKKDGTISASRRLSARALPK